MESNSTLTFSLPYNFQRSYKENNANGSQIQIGQIATRLGKCCDSGQHCYSEAASARSCSRREFQSDQSMRDVGVVDPWGVPIGGWEDPVTTLEIDSSSFCRNSMLQAESSASIGGKLIDKC